VREVLNPVRDPVEPAHPYPLASVPLPTVNDYRVTVPGGQPTEGTTTRSGPAITRATVRLAAVGVASARADAELLAAYVLGVPRGRLAVSNGFADDQLKAFEELIARRAAREPLQHLTGTAPFRHLEVAVGPGVFVPRPETELLAGWGIEVARAAGAIPVVLDLCSGTGAIALAVAQEVPGAVVYAVERSPEALHWLRRNVAERSAAGDSPVTVVAADVTRADLLAELTGVVDVVLCNPPYVPDGTEVPPEVLNHDPADAVFGGPDGLGVARPVVARAAALLRPGGVLGIEHDETQASAVPGLLVRDGRFEAIERHTDLAGRPRYTTARHRRG
jgi:release factor glutamine methyltransferase